MSPRPWWIDRVEGVAARPIDRRAPGALWHLCEQLQFIRENVDEALLQADFAALPVARESWARLEATEAEALAALTAAVADVARAMCGGELGPDLFRATWQQLGFAPNVDGAATPADDYLHAVCGLSGMSEGEPRPPCGTLSMASRAERICDFLEVTAPGVGDCVYDLGSGGGKFALTVAASTFAQVHGIEYGLSYVTSSQRSMRFLGLQNLAFTHADVRDADLSAGTIFHLYYPFHGPVALAVAQALGALGRHKAITVYLSGPLNGFREHFLGQVADGGLRVADRRGEFSEVLVLRSAGA